MPKLIFQEEGKTKSYDLPLSGSCRIGRSRHSDICLDHPSISESHCEIYVDPMMVLVTDLGSTNGTFINGTPVQKGQLANGQVLQVGGFAMVLEREVQSVVAPEMNMGMRQRPTHLENGMACCYNHAEAVAVMECTHCQKLFCKPCVHVIGLVGGKRHYLCPACHNHCHVYAGAMQKSSKGFFGGILSAFKKITGRFRN